MPYNFPPKIERELREFDSDDVGQVADEIRICKLLLRRRLSMAIALLPIPSARPLPNWPPHKSLIKSVWDNSWSRAVIASRRS